ncbi:hypothetical protein D9758_013466 [Tetrapyrgos nigripes]|uniref:Uncharacterized protein n=1 Tax=Tetrapyrgos nigripes TaxID=182062 RepID=A0A8H5CT53_9AGAR|nr:hypothetical protein D9758_013466 [Tetrapyrgos nigripes]
MISNLSKLVTLVIVVAVTTSTGSTGTASAFDLGLRGFLGLKRQGQPATCDFVLAQSKAGTTTGDLDLIAEFSSAIGRQLALETRKQVFNQGRTFVENQDGTFNVHNVIAVDGLTAQETASILDAWVGQTKDGEEVDWTFQSAKCEA